MGRWKLEVGKQIKSINLKNKKYKLHIMKNILLLALLSLGLFSCSNNSEKSTEPEPLSKDYTALETKAKLFFGTLPEYAENKENPLTPEKVALGKALYYDVRLSKDNTQSCNTCHNLDTYGVDNLPVSPGNDEGAFGTRNSPTTLNAALHLSQFWDGRMKDVEEQAGGPILNPVEMAMPSEKAVEDRLAGIEEYRKMFKEAFPESEKAITYQNVQKAIGAFERKLITPTRFDDFLAGNSEALTNEEKDGLETFMGVGCTTCHIGNVLGGNMFQKFGLYGNYWEYLGSKKIDEGKFETTQKESDKYIFKVPSLRNIAKTGPYLHDGSLTSLEETIKIMGHLQLNKELTDTEVSQIMTFLNTLTGEVPEELKM